MLKCVFGWRVRLPSGGWCSLSFEKDAVRCQIKQLTRKFSPDIITEKHFFKMHCSASMRQ